jgi:ubiquinone/menaquinone biosynthesis C-methylase UbiE/uncharacterized protein YbaR (Trm112 family)
MHDILLKILVCPSCHLSLGVERRFSSDEGELLEGSLKCETCGKTYPVTNGIPRFVEPDNYADSFGYQWNLFRKEQVDSHNDTTLSADRFWAETGWKDRDLSGKWMLDAGCGAGRFLDISSTSGADVVGIDISSAIDAAKANLEGRENVHFVQASIYELPFRPETFDLTYCIGVIQHTPDPRQSLRSIAAVLKQGGDLAVTIYPRKPWTKLFSKYWLRPVTKRMSKEKLLKAIKALMPVVFPLTDILFRMPFLGRVFMFAIPVANYVNEKQLSREQRYSWAILDTFDMLSPAYDQPMTEAEAQAPLIESGIAAKRLDNPGLNLVGKKVTKN